MGKLITVFLAICGVSLFASLQIGCGGGGGDTTESLTIQTYLADDSAWQGATVLASGDPSNSPCTVGSSGCNLSLPPTTEASGTNSYTFDTNALPDYWQAFAEPDSNCPYSGSQYGGDTTVQSIDNGDDLPVYCGSFNGTGASVTPSSCTVVFVNGNRESSCPTTLTITAASGTFPTTHELDSGGYLTDGSNTGSGEYTASSSTTITVAAPADYGENIITVWDPTNNNVLAAVGYTLHECLITQNGPYGTTETCPY
jgi:hypothetical protein